MSDAHTAYGGVRILDCTQGLAGPTATMYLADLGADVVKVEPPGGDHLKGDPGYLCANRGKRLITLDMADHRERAELRRLMSAADCVVFDGELATLERLGLDAASLRHEHPALIHAWLPALAARGRWSHLPDDPLLLAAVSGISDYHRAMSDRPVSPVVPAIAYAHGALAAAGIAAALLERRRTGAGRSLVVSGLHAVAGMQAAVVVQADGLVSPGREPKHGLAVLPNYAPYQCADGRWLYLGALTQTFFLTALEVLGLLELMALPCVAGVFANVLKPDVAPALISRLQERFAERPMRDWEEALDKAGVPVAPVMTRDEWFASPTVAANAMRVRTDHPDLGPVDLPGVPVALSETPGTVGPLPHDRLSRAKYWTDDSTEPRSTNGPGQEPAALAEPDRPLPLEGLRVVDAASFVAGTFGPSILAHYGASVTKLEPLEGDPYRLFSVSFAAINQAKRGVAVDLKHPDGKAVLVKMLQQADVFVENLRASSRPRLGLDWPDTSALNERLVHCSVGAFGAGPLADKPGFDPLVQARSGLMAAQGGADEPAMSSMLVHDIGTGAIAAVGILAALYHRESSGRGQHVTTSLANSSLMLQAAEFTTYPGRPAATVGYRDWPGPGPYHQLYHCSDAWIFLVGGGTDGDDVRRALGLPAQSGTDPEKELSDAIGGLTVIEALDRLGALGIAAAKVLSRHHMFSDPWLEDNRFFHLITDSQLGVCRVVRTLADWPDTAHAPPARSFALGEDTIEVLAEHGYGSDAIAALLKAGAIRATTAVNA
jgi:crotonobetainyl-CoA:carnitine CoA-transferase CaiB-like acyl-CoA transferase